MIKLKIYGFLCAFLFLSTFLPAQDILRHQFAVAESLFAEQQYYNSITELKRVQFFDSLKFYLYPANYLIAKCYKGGAKYNDAIKYFRLALSGARNSDEIYDIKSEIIRCNILRSTTEQALLELDLLESEFKNKQHEINYWRGWSNIFDDKWGEAARFFERIQIDHPLKKFSDSIENAKYSILFPKLISYILPGVGQFYTGSYISGLMSLGWNALFVYLSLNSFYADRVFDGLITTALFFRFHRGNVQNAEKFTIEKNKEITNKALLYLQSSYKGLKP